MDEIYNVKLPTWALSAIFNGDYSGLEDREDKMIDDYLASFPPGGIWDYEDLESHFTHDPPFGLACDVVDATYTII